MFFFPYRIDARIAGLPILTVLICLLCCLIYWEQYNADTEYFAAIEKFCLQDLSKREVAWLNRVPGDTRINRCAIVLESIRDTEDADLEIERLARLAKPVNLYSSQQDNIKHVEQQLREIYRKFERDVPEHLTSGLAYDPKELDIVKMVTSTFSHGSATHLLGNLLFFYIFAASVELVFGFLVFSLFITLSTFGTSLAYSNVMAGVEGALPTVGLSGVVMAAVVALAIMMPAANIRCFFWFLVFYRIFKLPALLIAIWYVGWDVYGIIQQENDSYINYTAHVSGAMIGAAFGLYYLLFRKQRLQEMAV